MNPVRMRHTIRSLMGLLLVVPLMFSGGTSLASAQETEPTTIRPELIDSVIEIRGENYVLDRADLEEYPHGRGERIYISSLESKGFAEISFFDDEDLPDETIAVMLSEFQSASSSFEILEQGNIESVHYALAHFLIPGYEGYFYIEVAQDVDGNVDIQQNFYSLNADFSEQLDLVRADVTIDGVPFLQAPVIDVSQIVAADQAERVAAAATPVVETIDLQGNEVSLTMPVRSYNEYTNDVLESVFFTTSTGAANGLVGYLRSDAPAAVDVIEEVISNVPEGERPPREIETKVRDDTNAVGLYLVPSDEGDMLMVISVSHHAQRVWRIESLAAPPGQFLSEYEEVVGHVTFEGRPFFGDIDIKPLVEDADQAP